MVSMLLRMLIEDMDITPALVSKWILSVDVSQHIDNYGDLWKQITQFVEPNVERFLRNVGFRIVVIDNADQLTASAQQGRSFRIFIIRIEKKK